MIRTDLAIESIDIERETPFEGISKIIETKENVKITTIIVENEEGAKIIGKCIGTYITLEVLPFAHNVENSTEEIEICAEKIRGLLPNKGLVLVTGIGNRAITPDALGPKVASGILATRHIPSDVAKECCLEDLRPVAAISPGVLGQTGFEVCEIILSLSKSTEIAAIIAVDALASRSLDRLGCTIQISDTGISPGSGVDNARKKLNKDILNIPVIAIGVPTVVDAATIVTDIADENDIEITKQLEVSASKMMVTPRDIDVLIDRAAKLVSMAINKALQPSVSVEDLNYLIS